MTIRLATQADVDTLASLMQAAIEQNQRDFLQPDQIEASKSFMGIDHQLIDDATYFVVRLGATEARAAQGALKAFRGSGARVMGCVATTAS